MKHVDLEEFFSHFCVSVLCVKAQSRTLNVRKKKAKSYPEKRNEKKKLNQRILWRIVCCFQSKPMPNTRILNKKNNKTRKELSRNIECTSHVTPRSSWSHSFTTLLGVLILGRLHWQRILQRFNICGTVLL